MSRWTPRALVRRIRDQLRVSLATASGGSDPDLDVLMRTWDALGERDPLWAVLTHPDARGQRWDVGAFFEAGRKQVDAAVGFAVDDLGWPLLKGSALDFGCGVGRLTQALCDHFDRVVGVDIAPSMIECAERFNRFGDRCRYRLNRSADLSQFPDLSFDFVYSTYVLQHMHPSFARLYVEEFVRVLTPDGLGLFNIPTARLQNRPMPRSCFTADQELLSSLPSEVSTSGYAVLEIQLANRGPCTWPSRGFGRVRLGARWRSRGRPIGDEGRAALNGDLEPGHAVRLTLRARAPASPGRYRLEWGPLQEGVVWFGDKRGPLDHADVEVVGPPLVGPTSSVEVPTGSPVMEMHSTPADRVVTWVEGAGGKVVRMLEAPPDEEHDGVLFAIARRSPST